MTPLSKNSPSSLRPSEKVQQFFFDHLLKAYAGTEKRLPTIKDVSSHLGVSTSTTQAVFAQLAKEGHIIMVPGRGTFVGDCHQQAAKAPALQHVISVAIHEPELMQHQITWGKEICAGILREVTNTSPKMVIRPFFVDKQGSDDESLRNEAAESSAAIVFPDTSSANVARAFRQQGKAVIYITPPSLTATRGFVSPNYLRANSSLAQIWKQLGKKHIVLLLHNSIALSATCASATAGFFEALYPLGYSANEAVKLSYHTFTDAIPDGIPDYLESLFAGGVRPDAIYSTGDGLAEAAVEWLLARNISIPDEVSVVGGTGLHRPSDISARIACTTLQQPFDEIGREAVRMAVKLISDPDQPQPGVYIDARFCLGQTTTEEENRLLQRQEDTASPDIL